VNALAEIALRLAPVALMCAGLIWFWPRVRYIAGATTVDPAEAGRRRRHAQAEQLRRIWQENTGHTLTTDPLAGLRWADDDYDDEGNARP